MITSISLAEKVQYKHDIAEYYSFVKMRLLHSIII